MPDVPPDYVAELYRQLAFISAVLGGFAVAFLGALLGNDSDRRVVTTAIGFAASAGVLFAVGTIGASFTLLHVVRMGIHAFDPALWDGASLRTKGIADFSILVGLYALVVGVGLSGWARSRATGRVTTAIAGVGLILLTVVVAGTVG